MSKKIRKLFKRILFKKKKKSIKSAPTPKINEKKELISSFPSGVKSPVPSMLNYPEDANPEYLLAIDKKAQRVKTPPSGAEESLTLTGEVIGNGPLSAPINTSLSLPINAQNSRIVNVASPINTTDVANKSYVDAQSGGGTVTLQGAVTGTGDVGTPIDTTLATTVSIDTIEPPTTHFDFKWIDSPSHERIINHEIPEIATTNRSLGTNIFVKDGTSIERSWLEYFNLGTPSSDYGEYFLRFWDEATGFHTPLSIYSGGINTTFIRTKLDLDGNRATNAGDPVSDQDLATKKWVLDNAGGGSGDYLVAESQYISNDIQGNETAPWKTSTTQVLSGSYIQQLNSTNFLLQPGKSYELIAWIPFLSTTLHPDRGVNWRWFQSPSTALGIEGASLIDLGNYTEHEDFRPAIAIITPTSPTEVYVKLTQADPDLRISSGSWGYCKIRTLN